MPARKLNVCSVDIGYSNVKIATGFVSDSEPKIQIFPAYATTDEVETVRIQKLDRANEVAVFTGENRKWRVFTERPDAERELHKNYHATENYLALYFGSLIKMSEKVGDTIDLLITGLPVNIAQIDQERIDLAERLTGTFEVQANKEITVKRVLVLPQGVGVINDIAFREGMISDEELGQATILVVDPGFYSFDSVAFKNGNRVQIASGSSTNATSAIIDRVCEKLRSEDPDSVNQDLPQTIEMAIRAKAKTFFNGFKKYDLQAEIEAVSPVVTESVMKELLRNTRSIAPIHVIAAAGGAIDFYEGSLQKYFPKARYVVSPEPVESNARGYWNYGLDTILEDMQEKEAV